eukprot:TRINITY_DN14627_c0_g1_i1.p1 TRINITY_DN14627_c0_g1~~TRINITY_DN14627_c0_g1_i1.p1  ORF type:complete len:276 (-),score=58.85 TRINITY_DN14627_c0_g1_i1:64-891(-)
MDTALADFQNMSVEMFESYSTSLEGLLKEHFGPDLPVDPHVIAIGVALQVAILVVAFLALLVSRSLGSSKRNRNLILLGPVGSGKTALYGQLRDGRYTPTVSSMKTNEQTFAVESVGQPVRVVDFPGHRRLSPQLAQHLKSVGAVVFVVDSIALGERETAQQLFSLLTDKQLNRSLPPILVACNKSDNSLAKSPAVIKKALEDEINELRTSSTSVPSQSKLGSNGDDEEEDAIVLGVEGERFEFEDAPMEVTVCKCSARTGDVDEVLDFIGTSLN